MTRADCHGHQPAPTPTPTPTPTPAPVSGHDHDHGIRPDPGTPPPAPDPDDGTPRRSRTNLWITLGVAVVAAVVGGWLLLRPTPVTMDVDGATVTNRDEILAAAEDRLAEVVAADDSGVTDDTACFFGSDPDRAAPRIVCGPVLLGTSPVGQPWLVGRVDWGFPTDGAVTGAFNRFDGDTVDDPGELVRPDGREPGDQVPAAPTSGLRTADGERVVDPQSVLAGAEATLVRVAPQQRATVADDAACWFGTSQVDGRTITDDSLWCGPVLTVDSDPSAFWTRTSTGFADDDGLPSTATRRAPDDLSIFTGTVDEGVTLWRPDGREPPTSTDLPLPDAGRAPTGPRSRRGLPPPPVRARPPGRGTDPGQGGGTRCGRRHAHRQPAADRVVGGGPRIGPG